VILSNIRASARLVGLVVTTLILLGVYYAVSAVKPTARIRIVKLWHRLACRRAGLRVRVSGAPVAEGAAMLTCNHISYLDISVIASRTDAIFVAKDDVAHWPCIGYLARLVGTIFVERDGTRARSQVGVLAGQLARGNRVVVFPEATSTEGWSVRPFKSSLFEAPFSLLTGGPTLVQPITIAYLGGADGRPLTARERRQYAWVGDDTLVPHLWQVLRRRGAEVHLLFHPPVDARAFASRKQLAEYCHAQTARGLVHLTRTHVNRSAPAVGGRRFWTDWQDFPAFAYLD